MIDQIKCKKCGQPGKVACVDDLFYARCTHCTGWPQFEFLGATKDNAIRIWNLYNQPPKQGKKKCEK